MFALARRGHSDRFALSFTASRSHALQVARRPPSRREIDSSDHPEHRVPVPQKPPPFFMAKGLCFCNGLINPRSLRTLLFTQSLSFYVQAICLSLRGLLRALRTAGAVVYFRAVIRALAFHVVTYSTRQQRNPPSTARTVNLKPSFLVA